jgi:hypothetical protein
MQPASPNFIRLIELVCQGVAKRHEGTALARDAGDYYLSKDELLCGGSAGVDAPAADR